jgi:hypothetical protein
MIFIALSWLQQKDQLGRHHGQWRDALAQVSDARHQHQARLLLQKVHYHHHFPLMQ